MKEGKRIDHLSNSQLNELLACLRRYKLRRIDGVSIPEVPAWWNVGGNTVHKVAENWEVWREGLQVVRPQRTDGDRSGATAEPETGTDLRVLPGDAGTVPGEKAGEVDAFDWRGDWEREFKFFVDEQLAKSNIPAARWRAAKKGKTLKNPGGENRAWWDENGPEFAKNWAEFLVTQDDWELYYTPDGRSGVELFTQFLVGGTSVVAIPDRVYRKKSTGNLVIVDLKSGAKKPDAGYQLPIYELAMDVVFAEQVDEGFYFLNRTSDLIPDFSPVKYSRGLMEEMFSDAIRLAEEGPYLASPGSQCTWCSVRPACPYATRLAA